MIAVEVGVKENVLAPLEGFPAAQAQAQMRAINRTTEWSRTRTVEAITQNLAIKKSDLDGSHRFGGVIITHATSSNLKASVRVTGRRIPLFRFSGSPKKPPSTKTGITYRLDAGGAKKGIITNAFVATLKSGHTGFYRREPGSEHKKVTAASGKVFKSTGKGIKKGKNKKSIWSQLPIGELWGPSIPQVAENQPAFQKLLNVDAGERLQLQLEREVSFILTGTSKIPAAAPAGGGAG